uniref:Uncharacterized protein n=1 Tax=Meloidogyne enterolobii TaxID=390850 RepID=A0A6V7V6A0_MELEN|nr:unnamed protein product [Meloidogyne enterolobii]
MFYRRKAYGCPYIKFLDVVVTNGIFKKEVVVPSIGDNMFYEAFFRTNCYILNKKKEV